MIGIAAMKPTRLIQRLEAPQSVDNPFSFGGGYRNGGLTDEAMDLLRPIFSFDYMGAAEFEFGAVPEALAKLAQSKSLVAWSFPVTKVAAHWKERSKMPKRIDGTVYAIAPSDWTDEIEERVRGWALKPHSDLKENTRLDRSLDPVDEWDGSTKGWLELDNGFMFFTDPDMWSAAAELLNVQKLP